MQGPKGTSKHFLEHVTSYTTLEANKLMSSGVNPIFLRSFLGAVRHRLSTAQDGAVYGTAAVWFVQDLRNVQPTPHLWLYCPNLQLPEPAPVTH